MDRPGEFSELLVLAVKAWGWKYVIEQIAYAFAFLGEAEPMTHRFYTAIANEFYHVRNTFERREKEVKR